MIIIMISIAIILTIVFCGVVEYIITIILIPHSNKDHFVYHKNHHQHHKSYHYYHENNHRPHHPDQPKAKCRIWNYLSQVSLSSKSTHWCPNQCRLYKTLHSVFQDTAHCALCTGIQCNTIHSGKVHCTLHCSVDGWVEGGNYCRVQFRRQCQFTRLLTIYFLLLLLQRHCYSNVFFCTHTAIQPFCVYLIPPNSPSCIYCQYSIVYCNTSILLIHIHFKHDTKWWSCTVCMVSTLKCSIYSWADVYTLYCNIIGADMTSVVSNEQYIILKSSRVDVHHNVAST